MLTSVREPGTAPCHPQPSARRLHSLSQTQDMLSLTAPQKLTLLKAESVSDSREAAAGREGWEPEAFLPGELSAASQELPDATGGAWQSSQAGTPAAGRADATWEPAHLRTQGRGFGGEGIPALPCLPGLR